MKKVLLIILFVCFYLTSNAQFKKLEWKDEFGDSAGGEYYSSLFYGKFSNSATIESEATFAVFYDDNMDGGSSWWKVYEYGDNPANFVKKMGVVKIKKPDGIVEEFYGMFTGSTIYFRSKYYKKLKSIYTQKGEYKVFFRDPNSYDTSKYNFTISVEELKNDDNKLAIADTNANTKDDKPVLKFKSNKVVTDGVKLPMNSYFEIFENRIEYIVMDKKDVLRFDSLDKAENSIIFKSENQRWTISNNDKKKRNDKWIIYVEYKDEFTGEMVKFHYESTILK